MTTFTTLFTITVVILVSLTIAVCCAETNSFLWNRIYHTKFDILVPYKMMYRSELQVLGFELQSSRLCIHHENVFIESWFQNQFLRFHEFVLPLQAAALKGNDIPSVLVKLPEWLKTKFLSIELILKELTYHTLVNSNSVTLFHKFLSFGINIDILIEPQSSFSNLQWNLISQTKFKRTHCFPYHQNFL